MTKELFVNGELTRFRKETHVKNIQPKEEPVFTSRMEKREYDQSTHFDLRNIIDVKGFLKDIRENWNTYVLQVHQWIQQKPLKKMIVTGIFTVVFGFFATTSASAFIPEYTYQVKSGENVETIAKEHGVTVQQVLDANGLSSIDGKKILLPKVQDKIVTATALNIRAQSNTNSKIIGKYKKGDVVKVSYIENGWAGILIKGRVYYVSTNYLTEPPTASSAPNIESLKKTKYVTASSLRVRQAPTINSTILGSLKLKDPVYVEATVNGWAQITFNGRPAYVSDSYLTANQPKIHNHANKDSSIYTIKRGDTFSKIGRAFGISVSSIQQLNPTVDPATLKIGQKINLPAKVTTSATVKDQTKTKYVTATLLKIRQAPSTNSTVLGSLKLNDRVHVKSSKNGWAEIILNGKPAFVSESYLTANEPKVNHTNPNTDSSLYIVKRGDTFSKIGRAFGISVSSIQQLNPSVIPTKLKVGQQLSLPMSTSQLKVTAQITGIDRNGKFRFITDNGNTYAAKASGNILNELFKHQGKEAILTLEGKRGQQMTLTSLLPNS
ncbi:LysM peptidoglycan-binding domain-containing protein [Mesobacillus maritimus]|uniref:LysM peptidoglycan-binding domain-containing protein n=1 Tax=Mesobacillus maritimus TaxID=1643336 RepID=UPI00203AEF6C|nr:LysM peptidoglycan-binding domain-containing protein [Mesobacillus maritimus]MCM3587290.1 LysM peptidoglycan-binding domain-containing protein [Mesobacillus maritimus]